MLRRAVCCAMRSSGTHAHSLRPAVGASLATRSLASASSESESLAKQWVRRMNHTIQQYPAVTAGTLVAADMCSLGITYSVIQLAHLEFSSEFAVAFALSRPLRRLRTPLELVLAAPLARALPFLADVRVGHLLGNLVAFRKDGEGAAERPSTASLRELSIGDELRALVPPAARDPASYRSMAGAKRLLRDVAESMMTAIDHYGLAYTVSSRLLGLGIVGGLYLAVQHGVDVQGWLDAHGFGEAGKTAGTWAAAVVGAAALYPAALASTAWVAPAIGRRLARLRSTASPP